MSTVAKEPGQRAYEAWMRDFFGAAWAGPHDYWDELGTKEQTSWAAVEQACAVPAPSDQALSSGVERTVEGDPWAALAKYASETTSNIQPSWHGEKQGWAIDMMCDDAHHGGGYAPTLAAAARGLCTKLGIPIAPVASPAPWVPVPGERIRRKYDGAEVTTLKYEPSGYVRYEKADGSAGSDHVRSVEPVASPAAEAGISLETLRKVTVNITGSVPDQLLDKTADELFAMLELEVDAEWERANRAELRAAPRSAKGRALDRLVTVIDEAFGLQPVAESPDELVGLLERLLHERRQQEAGKAQAEWIDLDDVDVVGGASLPRPAAWSWAWVEPAADPEGWADLFETTALLRWNPHTDTWQGTSDCGDTIGLPHREVYRYAVVLPPPPSNSTPGEGG